MTDTISMKLWADFDMEQEIGAMGSSQANGARAGMTESMTSVGIELLVRHTITTAIYLIGTVNSHEIHHG
jgi:hypothetical protein